MFLAVLLLLFVADGSRQPTSGHGWRILGHQRGVVAEPDIAVIPSQAELDVAWERLRVRGDPPSLPSDAVTFWITATGTLGCPAHFAGVHVDPATQTVVASFTLALTAGCDSILVPDSFLVALDDDWLPSRPFRFDRVGPMGQPDGGIQVTP